MELSLENAPLPIAMQSVWIRIPRRGIGAAMTMPLHVSTIRVCSIPEHVIHGIVLEVGVGCGKIKLLASRIIKTLVLILRGERIILPPQATNVVCHAIFKSSKRALRFVRFSDSCDCHYQFCP